METLSVALALSGGELASRFLEPLEGHPMLDLCGVSRSAQDLARLLQRFRPDALLVSPQVFEDWGSQEIPPDLCKLLPLTPSFLLLEKDARWGKENLQRLFDYPFTFCGTVDAENMEVDRLYRLLHGRVAAFPGRPGPASPSDRRGDRKRTGCFIVCGCKGGVGSTLIASVLASTLACRLDKVLLTELDGDRSQLLHFKPPGEGKTLVELLPLAEEMSWDLVRVSMYRHPSGFHLLPFGFLHRGGGHLPSIPDALLRNLCFLFGAVVVDAAGHLVERSAPLLRLTQEVVLVSTPDALSVRCARQTASHIQRLGFDARRMRLVINRAGNRDPLRPQEISKAVGLSDIVRIPADRRAGLDFADLGVLPPTDSPLGRSVDSLAQRLLALSGDHPAAALARDGNTRRGLPALLRERLR